MKVIFLSIIVLISTTLFSGELDDFEKGIRTEPEYETESEHSSSSSSDECLEGCASSLCEEVTIDICVSLTSTLISGAIEAGNENKKQTQNPNKSTSFILPTYRFDSNFSYISDTLYSINNRIEAGSGAFAVAGDLNIYKEFHSEDTFYQSDLLFLFRMKFSTGFELDSVLGINYTYINEVTLGCKTGLNIRINPNKNWGLEFRPTIIFSEFITLFNYDMSIFRSFNTWGISAGYKYLGNEVVQMGGFYLGLRLLF